MQLRRFLSDKGGLRQLTAVIPVRPRVNLWTKTEEMTNAVWGPSGVTVTAGQADPDGGTTAFLLTGGGGGSSHLRFDVNTTAASCRQSIYAKAGTGSTISLNSAFGPGTTFNLSAGTTSGAGNIVDVGGGWYRCDGPAGKDASTARPIISVGTFNSTTTATIYVWHPQLEAGTVATPYQWVNTSSDYDETPV